MLHNKACTIITFSTSLVHGLNSVTESIVLCMIRIQYSHFSAFAFGIIMDSATTLLSIRIASDRGERWLKTPSWPKEPL